MSLRDFRINYIIPSRLFLNQMMTPCADKPGAIRLRERAKKRIVCVIHFRRSILDGRVSVVAQRDAKHERIIIKTYVRVSLCVADDVVFDD